MSQPTVASRFHHLHLRSHQPAAAADWYAQTFGLQRLDSADMPVVSLASNPQHGCLVWFPQPEPDAAAIQGTVGSTLDHIGWSVGDVDGEHQRLVRAGCESLVEPNSVGDGSLRISFLVDPFGTKVELLADRRLLGWHHVHLLTPDPDEHRAWWQRHFGGQQHQFNGLVPGLLQERVGKNTDRWWILFRETDDSLLPTAGRSVDHFAYEVADVDASTLALEKAGVPVLEEPRDHGPLRISFVEASGGVKVELLAAKNSPS